MMTNNFVFYGTKILAELGRDILYFPLWWYTRGLGQLIISLKNFLVTREKSLALLIWIKNIGKPMYGQYDWAGHIISFFMRIFQIIIRGIAMLFWFSLALAIAGFWLILPLLVIYEIMFQLFL